MTNLIPLSDSNLTSDEQTLLARLPLLAGDETIQGQKANYLAYRSTGFTHRQACELTGISTAIVNGWKHSDPEFEKWESQELPRLQREVGNDVIKFDFLRNLRLLLLQDSDIIFKAQTGGVDELSPREFSRYKEIRRFYTPGDLLTLEKIINPERHQQDNHINIVLNWGGEKPARHVIESTGNELPRED